MQLLLHWLDKEILGKTPWRTPPYFRSDWRKTIFDASVCTFAAREVRNLLRQHLFPRWFHDNREGKEPIHLATEGEYFHHQRETKTQQQQNQRANILVLVLEPFFFFLRKKCYFCDTIFMWCLQVCLLGLGWLTCAVEAHQKDGWNFNQVLFISRMSI